MSYFYHHFLFTTLITISLFSHISHAEITFDGSQGEAGALSGPNYLIETNRGTLHGNNLFHSFEQFNLQLNESATFTGPNQINNIIGRVTGGNISSIDGTINSAIPDANLYLLNPNGIMFGPNASLNIDGSFYSSSADYLRFADGQQFDTQTTKPSILTTAAPEAFGFLDNQPGNITVNDSTLNVPIGKNLSIIGGDIQIQGQNSYGALLAPGGSLQIAGVASSGEVKQANIMDNSFTKFGNISIQNEFLNTTDNPGKEVLIRGGHFFMNNATIQTHADLGYGNIDIRTSESLQIKSSALQTITNQNNAGNIILRGQQIKLSDNSTFINATQGIGQAGDIVIEANDSLFVADNTLISNTTSSTGKGGNITLVAPQLQINNSKVNNVTQSSGQGGDVIVKAEDLTVTNGALILVKTEQDGSSGMINIQATKSVAIIGFNTMGNQSKVINQTSGKGDVGSLTLTSPVILLANYGVIGADTLAEGQGGDILIKADNIKINSSAGITSGSTSTGAGGNIQIEAGQLELDTGLIRAITFGQGNSGQIQLKVNNLVLANGAQIDASSIGDGQGGAITVTVTNSAEIFGQTVAPQNGIISPSGISSSAFGKGDSGVISLSAQSISLDKRGTIQTLTQGAGNAGDIVLNVKNLSITEGGDIDASNEGSGQGKGGNIIVNATDKVFITAELFEGQFFGGIYSNSDNAGAGGDVSLSAKHLTLQQGGAISAASNGSGNAGHLILSVDGALKIKEGGQINTSTQNTAGGNITVTTPVLLYLQQGQITTSVKGGKGDGGNITIDSPIFVAMNDGKIIAQAHEGHGGNINLKSNQLIKSKSSLISASSKLGVDGNVKIDSPDIDMEGFLVILPGEFADASNQMKTPCSQRIVENMSSFVVNPSEGSHSSPDDLLPSGPVY
ncbi:filamentous hemagglutinin N-terminal domain-containing protein [Candidatus Halobeggiatoa sp. HSG11]|nr:filamentous hemagglutinin N-terminal domain-containing protein [Candidatus Halobeggiatoa sp. HSG11]